MPLINYMEAKKKLYSADITELFDIKNNKNVDV
jgi:hypothetical protein